MKKNIFFSIGIFLLFISMSFAQSGDKFKPALDAQIQNKEAAAELTVWIYFKDKGTQLDEKLSLAEKALSPLSRTRRQRSLKNKPLVSFYDIPILETYLEQVNPFLSKKRHQSKWLNAISAKVTKMNLEQIAALDCVASMDIVRMGKKNNVEIEIDKKILDVCEGNANTASYNLDYGNSLTQLEQMNVPLVHDLGYTGSGVIVCVMDAGFRNYDIHPNFSSMDIMDTYDFVNDDPNVDDQATDMGSGSHGRATLSTIGGFVEGELIGPAYNATYLLAKTENTESETQLEEDNWVAAAEWAEGLGADITSTSLGYIGFDDGSIYDPSEMNGSTATITIAADILAGMGVLVVNSAGNSGNGVTTIGAPADGFDVMAIGAVNADGDKAGFSSVGPTADGRIKPDVMAMGVSVVVATGTDNYGTSNGTSFSCPLVAGAAAVLMEMVPTATSMEIYEALKMSADNAATPNNDYGWGIINLYAAFEYLTSSDTEAPMAVCQDATVELGMDGTANLDPIALDGGSTDNIGIESFAISSEVFACADIGNVDIILTVTDLSGNTAECSASVTVQDNMAPVADLQTLPELFAECEVTALITPTATDNCTGAITDAMHDAMLPITTVGSTQITWTYTDDNGNSSIQMQALEIEDNTNPVALAQNLTVDLDGMPSVSILASEIDAGSTDNCGITNLSLDVNTFTAVGMYPVVLSAEDATGNVGTSFATVTVINTFVSTFDLLVNKIEVYPNPVDDAVYLVFDMGLVEQLKVSILTANGQLVKSVDDYHSSDRIDVSEAPNGFYLLKIEDGGEAHFVKLSIAR